MAKKEIVEELFDCLRPKIDEGAMHANIMFQLQLAFAVMETPPEIDLDKVIDRIPQVMDLDDFLAYWIDFIAPEVTDQELRTLLNYLQSDIYREANEVLDKIDPMIQSAMNSYSMAVTDQLLDGVLPEERQYMN